MQQFGWVWFHLPFPSVYEKAEYPPFQVSYLDVANICTTTFSYFNSPDICLENWHIINLFYDKDENLYM
jgi:hypothetical protein